jgi:hypothetical protein
VGPRWRWEHITFHRDNENLLLVSKKARKEALKHLQLLYKDKTRPGTPSGYINSAADTLILREKAALSLWGIREPVLSSVKSTAISGKDLLPFVNDIPIPAHFNNAVNELRLLLQRVPNLDELLILVTKVKSNLVCTGFFDVLAIGNDGKELGILEKEDDHRIFSGEARRRFSFCEFWEDDFSGMVFLSRAERLSSDTVRVHYNTVHAALKIVVEKYPQLKIPKVIFRGAILE